MQVLHLGAVRRRPEEFQAARLLVRDGQVEAVAELDQGGVVQLLLAVGGHLALARRAHAVALLGVGQDHGGRPDVGGGGRIRGVDLHEVVAASLEAVDLLVGHALRQPRQFLVLAEEVVTVEAAVLGGEGLHLAVDGVGERADQRAGLVPREQPVPVAPPHQLDHVPAGTVEQLLELVDDPSVAAHRSVQPLQVAIDDPHQVVEALARSQRERAHALGLVHLAVAEHAPHLAPGAIDQAAMGQVMHEPRVVDGADRPYAHGPGRKLPELGHQVRMRVARQAAGAAARAGDLLAVVGEVLFVQPSLEEGTRIHPGRAVRLEEDEVAAMVSVTGTKEMVEARLEEVGGAGVAGNVAAQFAVGHVGPRHHRQSIPAHQRRQLLLDGQVAGKRRLLVDGDRVDVRRDQFRRPAHVRAARDHGELVEDEPGPGRAMRGHQRKKGVAPFRRFDGIDVAGIRGEETGEAVVGHA